MEREKLTGEAAVEWDRVKGAEGFAAFRLDRRKEKRPAMVDLE